MAWARPSLCLFFLSREVGGKLVKRILIHREIYIRWVNTKVIRPCGRRRSINQKTAIKPSFHAMPRFGGRKPSPHGHHLLALRVGSVVIIEVLATRGSPRNVHLTLGRVADHLGDLPWAPIL